MKSIIVLLLMLLSILPVAAEAPGDYLGEAVKASIAWSQGYGIIMESDGTLELHEVLGMTEVINKELYRLRGKCPEQIRNMTIIVSRGGSIAFYPLTNRRIQIGAQYLEPWTSDTWKLFYDHFGYRNAVGEIDGRVTTAYLLRHEIGHIIFQGIGVLNEVTEVSDKEWVKKRISVRATMNNLELSAEIFALIMTPEYKQGMLPVEIENKILRFAGCTL